LAGLFAADEAGDAGLELDEPPALPPDDALEQPAATTSAARPANTRATVRRR
jgi:hypothetical protein